MVDVQRPPADGFGARDRNVVFMDDIVPVPPEFPDGGAPVEAENDKGEGLMFVDTAIADGKLIVDASHPWRARSSTFPLSRIPVATLKSAARASRCVPLWLIIVCICGVLSFLSKAALMAR